MKLKNWVAGKIHGIEVTDKSIHYHGSVSIDAQLMQLAGIEPYEQVTIVNLNNGARWQTYALPTTAGAFTLNGGSARLGEVGDRCVILTYAQSEQFEPAQVVFCNGSNQVSDQMVYEHENT